eukprot:8900099-Pyramimonas_sp.AAC.1
MMREHFEHFMGEEGICAISTFAERTPTYWKSGAASPSKVLDYVCISTAWGRGETIVKWLRDG